MYDFIKLSIKWNNLLKNELNKKYIKKLFTHLDNEEKNGITIYPDKKNIFRALELCDYENIKVVILGQDPYHGENEANGLAFAVNNGIKLPPSLKNIFNELCNDINCLFPSDSTLIGWEKQGVLLLNTTLTVQKNRALSHKNIGWEKFTNFIIKTLNNYEKPLVFILWGKQAQEKIKLINKFKHCVITSAHPSPLSCYRGFNNSKPFSKANSFLKQYTTPIQWEQIADY